MPWAPRRACIEPRCPGFAIRGEARCALPRAVQQGRYEGRRLKFYRSSAWRRLAKATVAAAASLGCIDCGSVEHLQADHLITVREDPTRGLDPENLTVRCRRCHSARTSREHSWNRRRP